MGFLFVGRGSDAQTLRTEARALGLTNVVFFDEIDPDEIPGLYAQCDIGLVSLDRRHKTHNIPGKFLSYMRSGLPVLASVNPGNDILKLPFNLNEWGVYARTPRRKRSKSKPRRSCAISTRIQVMRRAADPGGETLFTRCGGKTNRGGAPHMKVLRFTQDYLASLIDDATKSPRLRQHTNIHTSF